MIFKSVGDLIVNPPVMTHTPYILGRGLSRSVKCNAGFEVVVMPVEIPAPGEK
jgi:hypothetical protein